MQRLIGWAGESLAWAYWMSLHSSCVSDEGTYLYPMRWGGLEYTRVEYDDWWVWSTCSVTYGGEYRVKRLILPVKLSSWLRLQKSSSLSLNRWIAKIRWAETCGGTERVLFDALFLIFFTEHQKELHFCSFMRSWICEDVNESRPAKYFFFLSFSDYFPKDKANYMIIINSLCLASHSLFSRSLG